MDVEKQVAYWRDGAEEDMAVALELMQKRRFRHAVFLAELAVEKMLKAHVTQVTKNVPPKTHSLSRLVELGQISLSAEQNEFLARLQKHCLEGRYPDFEMPPVPEPIGELYIRQSQEILKWLTSLF